MLDCPVCYESYDTVKYVPRIICCGHTLCSNCITKLIHYYPSSSILKCPLDNSQLQLKKRKASCFPKNIIILRLIEKIAETPICQEHQRKLEWTLKDEGISLCSKCIVVNKYQMDDVVELSVSQKPTNESGEKVIRRKKYNKAIAIQDQPALIIEDEIIKKLQTVKNFFVKAIGIALVLFLLLHPFFRIFSYDKSKLRHSLIDDFI